MLAPRIRGLAAIIEIETEGTSVLPTDWTPDAGAKSHMLFDGTESGNTDWLGLEVRFAFIRVLVGRGWGHAPRRTSDSQAHTNPRHRKTHS